MIGKALVFVLLCTTFISSQPVYEEDYQKPVQQEERSIITRIITDAGQVINRVKNVIVGTVEETVGNVINGVGRVIKGTGKISINGGDGINGNAEIHIETDDDDNDDDENPAVIKVDETGSSEPAGNGNWKISVSGDAHISVGGDKPMNESIVVIGKSMKNETDTKPTEVKKENDDNVKMTEPKKQKGDDKPIESKDGNVETFESKDGTWKISVSGGASVSIGRPNNASIVITAETSKNETDVKPSEPKKDNDAGVIGTKDKNGTAVVYDNEDNQNEWEWDTEC